MRTLDTHNDRPARRVVAAGRLAAPYTGAPNSGDSRMMTLRDIGGIIVPWLPGQQHPEATG